jgi:hypothetical protein
MSSNRYCELLSVATEERDAQMMAEWIYGAVAEEHADDPNFDHDKAFEESLIEARHMLCERDYWKRFAPEELFHRHH